ncbi:hypothetical protein, partial [Klebsiella pneumoniae]|uniref:hypothetical protein n=1 Tax=Klebsiella pneumoniae TaxID=573 RepID=UPI003013F8CA
GDGKNGQLWLSVRWPHCALNNELQERDGGAWAGFEPSLDSATGTTKHSLKELGSSQFCL